MQKTNRSWTVYLIHHTHTDIGYTETQSRIENYHVDFIDQLLELHAASRSGDKSLADFRWTMECFWSVERWLDRRGESERARFASAVKDGFIGLSGTYLHFNEMIDNTALRDAVGRAAAYGKSIGVDVDTALSADINGFSWGYSQALYDSGVRNLVNCLHSHHGLAPIGRRQLPFYWETPKGDKIWVWNGEHYMLGNVLGMVPEAIMSYVFEDEYKPTSASPHNLFYAEERLPRYLRQLEEDGYPVDFVPLHVGGSITDNAPPNSNIAEFAARWNKLHGDRIRVEMVTVGEFARKARAADFDVPCYRGDWPDWWSDGLASCPAEARFVRKAQRGLGRLRDARMNFGLNFPNELEAKAQQEVILYSEHTFNHSDSIVDPWDLDGNLIGLRKKAGSAVALDRVIEAEERVMLELGASVRCASAPRVYRVANPYSEPIVGLARLYLEGSGFDRRNIYAIVRDEKGKGIETVQKFPAPRGLAFEFPVELAAGEIRTFILDEGHSTAHFNQRNVNDWPNVSRAGWDVIGSEGESATGCLEDATGWTISSPYSQLRIDREQGLVAWSSSDGKTLLAEGRKYPALAPIYEHTPVDRPERGSSQMTVRRNMGRNRKGPNVERHIGRFQSLEVQESGPVATVVRLDYELPGASAVHLELRLENWMPRASWTLRLNKNSVWDPESVYLALPFDAGGDSPGQIWLDKTGAPVRPVEDQLPDTLTDWYCLQAGYTVCGSDYGIALAMPDAPLLQLGPLEPGMRYLAGYPGLQRQPKDALSWLMTNYWETNFDASIGGFHAAGFHLTWGSRLADPGVALAACRGLGNEFFCFPADS